MTTALTGAELYEQIKADIQAFNQRKLTPAAYKDTTIRFDFRDDMGWIMGENELYIDWYGDGTVQAADANYRPLGYYYGADWDPDEYEYQPHIYVVDVSSADYPVLVWERDDGYMTVANSLKAFMDTCQEN